MQSYGVSNAASCLPVITMPASGSTLTATVNYTFQVCTRQCAFLSIGMSTSDGQELCTVGVTASFSTGECTATLLCTDPILPSVIIVTVGTSADTSSVTITRAYTVDSAQCAFDFVNPMPGTPLATFPVQIFQMFSGANNFVSITLTSAKGLVIPHP
jgi:hypothetical protein